MTPERAKVIVKALYDGRTDLMGLPEWDHILAVVEGAPERGKVAAYFHDAVEDGLISYTELRQEGVTGLQLETIFLLTRPPDLTYREYIERMVTTETEAGEIACEIKLPDLNHNMRRPCPPYMLDMRRPSGRHAKARRRILAARHPSEPSATQ